MVYLVLGGVPGPRLYLPGGVPGPRGGVLGPGGFTWSRWVPAQVLPPLPLDRQTRVKHNLRKLRLREVTLSLVRRNLKFVLLLITQ